MSAPTPPRVDTRWALVTGASSGIGAAYAAALARRGYNLALAARRERQLQQLARRIASHHAVQTEVLIADLASAEGVETTESWIAGQPALRALVCSAGFGTRTSFAETPPARTVQMLRLHVEASLRLTAAALPPMLAAGEGSIVLVSSLSAFFSAPRYVTYAATKACLNRFAEALASEVAPAGVHVQALCPGLTRTEFFDTPEQQGFRYPRLPRWAWMSAEAVVARSLAELGRGRVIVVPGWHNQLALSLFQAPLFGRLLRWSSDRLTAGRELY